MYLSVVSVRRSEGATDMKIRIQVSIWMSSALRIASVCCLCVQMEERDVSLPAFPDLFINAGCDARVVLTATWFCYFVYE